MKPFLLLVTTTDLLQKCGPYDTVALRRAAAQEMKHNPDFTHVIEIDAHNNEFFAYITPSHPEQFR